MNIYPENFEHKIDFDTVREYIREKCLGPLGIDKLNSMHFSTDFQTIEGWLTQTHEFSQIISNKESFRYEHYIDIRDSREQVAVDHAFWLPEKEIPQSSNSLETLVRIVGFVKDPASTQPGKIKYPDHNQLADK